jgi:hypothetical protein
MYYSFVIFLFPLVAHASDIDNCNQIYDPNQKHVCIAKATLNVGECEKITNMGLRSTCIFKVRDGQRNVNSFRPMK